MLTFPATYPTSSDASRVMNSTETAPLISTGHPPTTIFVLGYVLAACAAAFSNSPPWQMTRSYPSSVKLLIWL